MGGVPPPHKNPPNYRFPSPSQENNKTLDSSFAIGVEANIMTQLGEALVRPTVSVEGVLLKQTAGTVQTIT